MQLELRNVCKKVGNEFHIADVSLTFEPGTLNILLGPTLSGKTSLMRLMAVKMSPASRCRNARWPWSTSSSSTTRT